MNLSITLCVSLQTLIAPLKIILIWKCTELSPIKQGSNKQIR